MANAHSTFWSTVAHKYDQVVDLQIGANTRALVRDRVTKEGLLGCLVEFGCGTGFTHRCWQKRRLVSWPQTWLWAC